MLDNRGHVYLWMVIWRTILLRARRLALNERNKSSAFDKKHSSFIRNFQVCGFEKKNDTFPGVLWNPSFKQSDAMWCLSLKPAKGKDSTQKRQRILSVDFVNKSSESALASIVSSFIIHTLRILCTYRWQNKKIEKVLSKNIFHRKKNVFCENASAPCACSCHVPLTQMTMTMLMLKRIESKRQIKQWKRFLHFNNLSYFAK